MLLNFFNKQRERKLNKENEFLEKFIFHGLTDLNTGFDVPSIRYFSLIDFEIVLKRLESYGINVLGIEPWLDGEFYDVISYEEYDLESNDFEWVQKAMNDFVSRKLNLQYSASYFFPNGIPPKKEINNNLN